MCNNFPGGADAAGLGTSLCGPLVWVLSGRDGAVEGFSGGIWRIEDLLAGACGELPADPHLKRFSLILPLFSVDLFSCSHSSKRELLQLSSFKRASPQVLSQWCLDVISDCSQALCHLAPRIKLQALSVSLLQREINPFFKPKARNHSQLYATIPPSLFCL